MNIDLNSFELTSLRSLFRSHFNEEILRIVPLPGAGSDRKYYRIFATDSSVIASCNPDHNDHRAFLYLCTHFRSAGLAVPEIYASNPDDGTCLMQDLGDETLLAWIEKNRRSNNFFTNLTRFYKQSLSDLIRFQLDGDKLLSYQQLPMPAFDAQSMQWDLNYFKYYFLKPAGILFDERELEKDFNALIIYLSGGKLQGFMYRDFQGRNIMMHDEKLFYIDFQGGRKGPLQYDLASLLFQAKAALPDELKTELINFYVKLLQKRVELDSTEFRERLNGFVLLRLLQVMGAYGFRGWFERKPHFLESIPMLKPNLEWVLSKEELPLELSEINRILSEILFKMENDTLLPKTRLTITINSFSYRRGIPYDPSGHGGGFVFDCRLLPNPGRLEEYRLLTGMDEPVSKYLDNEPAVNSFVVTMLKMVNQVIDRYRNEGYEHLQINFGCTGGRHRSVYCAEKLAVALGSEKEINVTLKHQELKNI
jgi:aminoglycoside/choline kinase family phosphotransferase